MTEQTTLMGLKEGAASIGMDFYWFRELVETGQIASLQRNQKPYVWAGAIDAYFQREIEAHAAWLAAQPADRTWPAPREKATRQPKEAKERRTDREYIPPGVRFAVLRRSGFRCVYCGQSTSEGPLHVDHVVPVSKGGSSDPDNLVAACQPCNIGKHDKLLDPSEVTVWARN